LLKVISYNQLSKANVLYFVLIVCVCAGHGFTLAFVVVATVN